MGHAQLQPEHLPVQGGPDQLGGVRHVLGDGGDSINVALPVQAECVGVQQLLRHD